LVRLPVTLEKNGIDSFPCLGWIEAIKSS